MSSTTMSHGSRGSGRRAAARAPGAEACPPPGGQRPAARAAPPEREAVPPAVALDRDPLQLRPWLRPGPAGGHQVNPVAAGREPAEDLEEMQLGSPGARVLPILPVDQEDPHSRPSARATASSTPLTNPGDCSPPKRWASQSASSMATLGGT